MDSLTAVIWLMFFYCSKDLGVGQKYFKKGVRRARENTFTTHLSLATGSSFFLEHNKHAKFSVTFEGP